MPVPAAQLSAWIGPCISPSRYQVGEDVWRHFTQRYAETMKPSSNNGTKKLLQLANIAELQLREAGLAVVIHSNVCSYQDPRLYSFRQWTHQNQREKRNPVDTGRMASVIMRQQA
ncbi:MAG: laccase domain-containing protein [Gammaproteobacteria bacterium]|nr:laccase domain-containing protein [Gammaproteobacteria bacterium]